MAITQFTLPVPTRDDPPGTFVPRANTLIGELPPFVDQMNIEITNINTKAATVAASLITILAAESAAVAAANYVGPWTGLTGPLAQPASVYHIGAIWLLIDDLANVALSVPGPSNPDWLKLDYISETRTISAGAGLTGGGNLSMDRSFNVGNGIGIVVNADDVAIDKATASNIRAGTANKVVDSEGIYSGNAPVSVTDVSTITLNLTSGRNFTVTIGGARNFAAPSNQLAGQTGVIFIKQDGTGGRTPTFATDFNFIGGTPYFGGSAGKTDVVWYFVQESGVIICTFAGGS